MAILDEALGRRRAGRYQVHAAIAACHATAPEAGSTDWAQIAAVYSELALLAPSPVVDLNHAVAVAIGRRPELGRLSAHAPGATAALQSGILGQRHTSARNDAMASARRLVGQLYTIERADHCYR